MNIQINFHVYIYNEYLWWNSDIYFTKKNIQKDIFVLRNILLNIQRWFKYHECLLTWIEYLFEYLWEHYESIEYSNKYSKICMHIQKNIIFEYLFEYSTFWIFILWINIQKSLEYSRYLWIFMIFKWVWSPDGRGGRG